MKISSEIQANSPQSKQSEINALEAQKNRLQSEIQQLKSSSTYNENQIDNLKRQTDINEAKIHQNQSQIQSISTEQQQQNITNSPAYIIELSMRHKNSNKAAEF